MVQVLIFSFSVRVLDCIEEMMLAHGYVTERLDGSTPPDQRQQRVNDFNNSRGVFAFLISTTAGGKREGGLCRLPAISDWPVGFNF